MVRLAGAFTHNLIFEPFNPHLLGKHVVLLHLCAEKSHLLEVALSSINLDKLLIGLKVVWVGFNLLE